jgi:DNA-binding NtrC family response regulator
MARILLIDDEEAIRISLATLLRAARHTVVTAKEGREGLELQKKDPADLVITDIVMPGMDGFEFVRRIRGNSPDMPVIAICGNPSSELYLHMAKALGADRTFTKPFAAQALLEAVERALADSLSAKSSNPAQGQPA